MILYVLAGLVAFLVCIAAFLPASPAWQQIVIPRLQSIPELVVTGVDGTIWNGRAGFSYRAFPPSTLTWSVSPLALAAAAGEGDLRLSGEGHDINAHVRVQSDGLILTGGQGLIDASFVNSMSESIGLTFPGEIVLSNIEGKTSRRWFTDASGDLAWEGGTIATRTPNGMISYDLPPLRGQLSMEGEKLKLTLQHDVHSFMDISLGPDGWAKVDIYKSLFQHAGLNIPGGEDLPDPVVQVEEQLF
ncbi:MAG: type II secretion system protein N [Pseudomonadota bacterium]